MDDRDAIEISRTPGLYHGWLVVAAAFFVALFGFGLGFYGPGIYLVALKARQGWSIAELSSVITTYYVLGASFLFFGIGSLFERYGARKVLCGGIFAMGVGLVLLTWATRLWQVYAAFALMSLGWATMSGAAINIIVAPWFERRRGLAVSWALNGASAGGVIIAPALTSLTNRYGFELAVGGLVGSMLAVLMPVVIPVLRPRRADECDPPDSEVAESTVGTSPAEAEPFRVASILCSGRFISISVPFALGLTAQVGFFTHQMAFLSPMIGTVAAGWAISLTTFAAVVGRIRHGLYNESAVHALAVDPSDARIMYCGADSGVRRSRNYSHNRSRQASPVAASWRKSLDLNRHRAFALGRRNASSCPNPVIALSEGQLQIGDS